VKYALNKLFQKWWTVKSSIKYIDDYKAESSSKTQKELVKKLQQGIKGVTDLILKVREGFLEKKESSSWFVLAREVERLESFLDKWKAVHTGSEA
jgi:hypothetical protein